MFAAEPISKGSLVWRFDQRFDLTVPVAEYRTYPRFLRQLFDRYAYPNRGPTPTFSGVDGFALADIAAGEEITCDYAEFYENFEAALSGSHAFDEAEPARRSA